MRVHLIHRPARDIIPPLGGSRVSSYRIDLMCPSCCCGFPGPAELGAVAQMRCMITANRRASATIAFFTPRRLSASGPRAET
jgi:hypothetical protein